MSLSVITRERSPDGPTLREFNDTFRSLRKENFNLKLKIFFLEERCGSFQDKSNNFDGFHPKFNEVDICKKNIDLKVKNEELREELQQKQELLYQAATAIEAMKQTVFKSGEVHPKKSNAVFPQDIEDIQTRMAEYKRTVADKLCIIEDLKSQLLSKTKAHEKGCKTIQFLLRKVRDLNSEINQLNEETKNPRTNLTAENISELDQNWRKNLIIISTLLACRLKELADFLDSLIKNKSVSSLLSRNVFEGIQTAVNNSLNLSQNVSAYQGESSLLEVTSKCFATGNLTTDSYLNNLMNNMNLRTIINNSDLCSNELSLIPVQEVRNFSLNFIKSSYQKDYSYPTESEKNIISNKLFVQYDGIYNNHMSNKFILWREYIDLFQNGINNFKCLHLELNHTFKMVLKTMMKNHCSKIVQGLKIRNKQLTRKVLERDELLKIMRVKLKKLEYQVSDKLVVLTNLKTSFDALSLQTSRAVLERIKCMNEKENLEKLNLTLQKKIDQYLFRNPNLHFNLGEEVHQDAESKKQLKKDDETESHQTICLSNYINQEKLDSTRHGSSECSNFSDDKTCGLTVNSTLQLNRRGFAEHMTRKNEGLSIQPIVSKHDCDDVELQNIELNRKLEKTKDMFHKTLMQLRLSNQLKEQIENDIRNEIYKTHNILQNVKCNMANINN